MRRLTGSVLVLLSFLGVMTMRARPVFAQLAAEKRIEVDGRERTYYVFAPRKADRPMPLVFVLHGGGNSRGRMSKGRQMERYSQFNRIAEREGVIVCYPEGVGGNWNDGRGVEHITSHNENVDDIKFLRKVVDAVGKEYRLDRTRVFSTGISNGAFMSHRLAAEASDLVAGVAPLVGGMAEPIAEQFDPRYPVSLFVIQGDSDPLVPFAGGEVGYRLGRKRGRFIATLDAVAMYVKRNKISAQPTVTMLKDKDPDDGTTVESTRYPAGTGGALVQLYVIKSGGHAWPGRPAYMFESLIGKTCQDFDASEEIWKFFKSCPPRKPAG